MGASSSSILSEIFLQYIEASHIASIAKKHDYKLLPKCIRHPSRLSFHANQHNPFLQISTPYTPTYTLQQKPNKITQTTCLYKYPLAENPPSLTPLYRTCVTTLPNINMQPSDTSTIDYTHTN
jgi:hypothetical protein